MGNGGGKAALSINDRQHTLNGLEDLTRHLDTVRQMEYADVRLAGDGEITFLLTNRERGRAFLMCLTDENPVGFHAVSSGNSDHTTLVEFLLSNGQKDEWDVNDTVSMMDGLHALKHAFVSGGRAPFVLWHDDTEGPV